MPSAHFLRSVPVERTARVLQLEGLFDLPPSTRSERTWKVDLPIEERTWQIGLIVGPSGSGKTTIAKELFPDAIVQGYEWPSDQAVVDGFPAGMSIKEITSLLSSVGFSSPPSWLRPFSYLSNGEQFRATIARSLAEHHDLVVIDEFTSVVDRTVARIGSAAIARRVRAQRGQFVAVSCHDDIVAWLDPDWIYDAAAGRFSWRSLQGRPKIDVTIRSARRSCWRLFAHHHYLSGRLSPSARCYLAEVDHRPAAFTAVLPWPHPKRPGWREHRTVCLPDFQGVGIGNRVSDTIASLYRATGRPYRSVTSAPSMIFHRAKSPHWKMTRAPSRIAAAPALSSLRSASSDRRYTASFEYVGPARNKEARSFGILA